MCIRDRESVVERVNDGALDMTHLSERLDIFSLLSVRHGQTHHLHVGIVLDIVRAHDTNLSVHNHELGVESAQHWSMVVQDLQVKVGCFFGGW